MTEIEQRLCPNCGEVVEVDADRVWRCDKCKAGGWVDPHSGRLWRDDVDD